MTDPREHDDHDYDDEEAERLHYLEHVVGYRIGSSIYWFFAILALPFVIVFSIIKFLADHMLGVVSFVVFLWLIGMAILIVYLLTQ